MTAFTIRRPSRRPFVVVIGVLAIAIGTQVASVWNGDQAGLDEPLLAAPPAAEIDADAGPIGAAGGAGANAAAVPAPASAVPGTGANALDPAAVDPAPVAPTHVDPAPVAPANTGPQGFDPTAELIRIRADVDFWAARLTAHPNDIVSAVKLAESDVAEARMTGDVTAYLRAEQAADAAIVGAARLPARAVDAREHPRVPAPVPAGARARPLDPVPLPRRLDGAGRPRRCIARARRPHDRGHRLLAAGARRRRLRGPGPRSAARLRRGRPARRGGRRPHRGGLRDAGGLEGDALGFYHVTLGETLIAAGDAAGARPAFEAALAVRPDLPAALVGLAKLDAFDGDLSAAIAELDTAIAAIPLPDSLARRADLLTLRGEAGDARKAQADMATVEAIAQLAGEAGSVYDRGLSLYLSDHGARARARGQAGPRRARHPARRLRLRHPRLGAPQRGRRRRRRRPDAVRRSRPAPRTPGSGTTQGSSPSPTDVPMRPPPTSAGALALGPALDPVARGRATDALATIR